MSIANYFHIVVIDEVNVKTIEFGLFSISFSPFLADVDMKSHVMSEKSRARLLGKVGHPTFRKEVRNVTFK